MSTLQNQITQSLEGLSDDSLRFILDMIQRFVLCAFKIFQLPEILHLAEILFYFRTQSVGIYDLPGRSVGVCRHKYKIVVCFLSCTTQAFMGTSCSGPSLFHNGPRLLTR